MSQEIKLRPKGLYTHPGGLDVPEGGLLQADNVVIRREGVVEPRRGMANYWTTLAAKRLWHYKDTLYALSGTGTINRDTGAAWSALSGTYAPPDADAAKTRTAQAGQNLYFTTSAGIYMMDSATATPVAAGAPKAPGFERDQRVKSCDVAGLVRATNVVTATTTAAHGFYVGQVVNMNSAGEANFANGNKTIASVPSTTSFTYAETAGNATSTAVQTFVPSTLVGTGGFLSDGNQAAYRVVFNAPDANTTQKPGAPSPRFVVANATGTNGYAAGVAANVVVRAFIPSGALNTHYVQLFRSKQVATSTEPSEEMGLVWEALLKDAEITQGWVDIKDIVTDALRGESGYFTPSQEGIAQSNDRPPIARDLAFFRDSMFFANTIGRHRYEFTLLGVGGTTGIQDSDAFTFDNETYEATALAPTTSLKFKMETGGTASQNIRDTALNLVAAINRNTSDNSAAYYLSGPNDVPGKILIERKALGGSAFTPHVYATASGITRDAFAPVFNAHTGKTFALARSGTTVTATITAGAHSFRVGESVTLSVGNSDFPAGAKIVTATTSSTFTYTESGAATSLAGQAFEATRSTSSTNDTAQNRLYYSKPGLPEAVPELNYLDIGSKDFPIQRIIALRDALFVLKTDGVFRVTGSNGSFEWAPFDPTVTIAAPDSAVALDNSIYLLCQEGVVALNETGVEIVSRPIEKTILSLFTVNQTKMEQKTFGVAYESEREYRLYVISATGDTNPTQAYVYNAITGAWTRETLTASHGVVHINDDKLYLGGASFVLQERKARTYADYSDPSISVTTTSAPSATTIVVSSATGLSVGDILQDASTVYYGRITAINGTTLTIDSNESAEDFGLGASTVYTGISTAVKFAPVTGKNAGGLKLWSFADWLFQNAHIPRLTTTYATELIAATSATASGSPALAQWTNAATTWDGTERAAVVSFLVPQENRMGTRFTPSMSTQDAWAVWALEGLSLQFQPDGERPAR